MSLNPRWYPWAWVLAAALIAVTRSFELGISMDPALFSSVARTLARGGDFWSLSASENLFPQFYEHPFLAIWLQAFVFKLFSANDYTAKLLGLVFGCATFYYLYRVAEALVDEVYAHVFCLLCLLSVYFIGRFPTFYLEIPLTFFFFSSFYYFIQSLVSERMRDGIVSGVLLAAAFLTKGLATVPLCALLVAYAVFERRLEIWRCKTLYVCFGVCAILVGAFLGLQTYYGSYSLLQSYLARHHFGIKVHGAGTSFLSLPFVMKFLQTHPLHTLLAVLSPTLFFLRPELNSQIKSAFWVGLSASLLFLSANGTLGYSHLHYFYSIYPYVNLLAALSLYPLALRFSQIRLWRIGIGIAIFYQLVWHVLPIYMRRKGDTDLYLFSETMRALKQTGVASLDAYGISEGDWGYRELSFWYWEVDSRMVKKASELRSLAVMTCQQCSEKLELEKAGYMFCSGGKTYRLYVRPKLSSHCQGILLSPKFLR